ncbi:MAG: ribosome small subunit-dependent GTPase A [Gammaproteobacteria bacterium]
MPTDKAQPLPGLVIARHGAHVTVEDESGQLQECVTRKKGAPVVCGDQVLWTPARSGYCVIEKVLPHRSLLSRPDQRGRLKPICANVDQLVIVNALAPQQGQNGANAERLINLDLLDRYLVAAELIAARAVILVNKIDLATPAARETLAEALACYERMDYPVLFTSTTRNTGMAMLREQLAKHTSVLVGESGAGKSSLIQTLLPDLEIRIGAISAASGKGRHTTTTTTLYHLPGGGDLIDSPGVRDFSLWHIEAHELVQGFRDFRPWLDQCRFRNCRHKGEAGCTIAAAVKMGQICPQRLESYRAILASLEQPNLCRH